MRLTSAEKALIDLAWAFECAEAKTSCRHDRWQYLIDHHSKEVGAALGEAVKAKIKRDGGRCDFCGGDARKCYPRHANGRSCA